MTHSHSTPGIPLTSAQEAQRLDALHRYGIVDPAADSALKDVAVAAAALCGTPFAAVGLIDERDHRLTACFGEDNSDLSIPREDGVCQYTLNRGTDILEVEDLTVAPDFAALPSVTSWNLRFYAGAPMVTADGHALGALCVAAPHPRRLSDAQRTGLQALARIAASLLQRQTTATRLVDRSLRLAHDATTDALTGLVNRRGLERALAALPPRATLALLDLDHFKAVNDSAGHDAGDRLLSAFAAHLRAALRDGDLAGRWGGEEFLLVFPNVDQDSAAAAVERLRATWAAQAAGVTVSAGVASVTGDEDVRVTLVRADVALYEAKRSGRNRVCTA